MLRTVNVDDSVECQALRHGLRELTPVNKDYSMKYAAHKTHSKQTQVSDAVISNVLRKIIFLTF
jgi:hypothetical protein